MSDYMSMAHPRWRELNEEKERYTARLNTLRQRYAMHEATHAEYGVIRARNLKRSLQSLEKQQRNRKTRNKMFLEDFKKMEERAKHVESDSFAKRALQRAKEDYYRIVVAKRPQWQQQTMRAKDKRLKELEKQKHYLKARQERSAALFQEEIALNKRLLKRKQEAKELQAEIRRKELIRQLAAEKELNDQERILREKEVKAAEKNDDLRSELERVMTEREEAKRQHEMALETMLEQEQKLLVEIGANRYQEKSKVAAEKLKLLQLQQQKTIAIEQQSIKGQVNLQQEQEISKDSTLRQAPATVEKPRDASSVKQNDNVISGAPPSIQDENLTIQRQLQEKMEQQMSLHKYRQESLRLEQEHKSNNTSSLSIAASGAVDQSGSFNDSIKSEDKPARRSIASYDWEEWVNILDLLVQHIQRDQNASKLTLGYANADRAWGKVFLTSTSEQRKEWISQVHAASEENMGSKSRREMGKMGMVQWCSAVCECLRCVMDKGMMDTALLKKYMSQSENDKLTEDIVETHMRSFEDGRIEVWQSFVAHIQFLKNKCDLRPLYVAKTFAIYLTPNELQELEHADITMANLLFKVLVPPVVEPIRKSLAARTGLGSLTDTDDSFNVQGSQAASSMSKITSPGNLSPLIRGPGVKNSPTTKVVESTSKTKKKNVLDKLRNGYSFGSDDFEEDDDDFDVSIGNTTGGSFFNRSTNQSNNISLKKNNEAAESAVGSSSNAGGEDAKRKNVSDVVEVEEYDSFDDDF